MIAMCLLYWLSKSKGKLNQEYIANQYLKWYSQVEKDSEIDKAIENAMSSLEKMKNNSESFKTWLQNIRNINYDLQSNSWLMRTSPLAVFCYKLSDLEIYK